MINAQELINLIPAGGSLLFNIIRTQDGNLSIAIHPKLPDMDIKNGNKEAIEKALKPVVITGTPEELDADFMKMVKEVVAKKVSFQETMKNMDKEIEDAIKEAKTSGEKKVEDAKKTATAAARSKSRTRTVVGGSGAEKKDPETKGELKEAPEASEGEQGLEDSEAASAPEAVNQEDSAQEKKIESKSGNNQGALF